MKRAVALTIALIGVVTAAQAAPPEPPPPRPLPALPTAPERPTSETGADEAATEAAVPAAISKPRPPQLLAESEQEFEACTAGLAALGAEFEIVSEPVTSKDADCGIERPVTLSVIVPGVKLSPAGPMRCGTALALARWTQTYVVPSARLMSDRGAVTQLNHGSTYVCRRRNNQPTGKLSHHAWGNAIDIMSFEFEDGPAIRVQPRERTGSFAESFQRAVRYGACMTFTTVIGPGTDAAHADHLHLDIAERRSGWRLCQ